MTGFVQIIEFKTTRIDEVRALVADLPESGPGTARRGTVTADRDRPGYYLNIVEFDSYASAMENSDRPEVGAFAAKMAALCDEPPRFYNLDVVETWSADMHAATKAAVAGAATAVVGAAASGVTKARQRLQERKRSAVHHPGSTPTASAGPTTPSPVSDPLATRPEGDDTDPRSTPPPVL